MKRFVIEVLFVFLMFGCSNESSEKASIHLLRMDTSASGNVDYPDDTYCASVDYSNPHTGTRSNYTLTVDVEKDEVVELHWPNGGVLDHHHFSSASLDSRGHTSFTSDKGYEYDVQITGKKAGCFDNAPPLRQCRGLTKSGKRCKHMTDNANGLCWQHQKQK